MERALDPGSEAVFEMPLVVNADGLVYAKILPTDNNAVHDGFRANGSIAEDKGWIVRFALEREAGAREELGAFVDSTSSAPVEVRAGDRPTLVATVRVPADAAIGGPRQVIYVALAFRPASASGPGAASGASMDEARSITLVLSNALLPPAVEGAPPATPPEDTEAPVEEAPAIPPVGPLEEGARPSGAVVVQTLPTWFMAGLLAVGAALAIGLGVVAALLHAIRRDLASAREPRARAIPVRTPEREEPPAAPARGAE